ncbi:choice-of-anchor M domain-containing protein [Dermabacter vaginalis]|uniref:choice-of-anchor M domain-containing protein n=1 Tax=Dermabacter vaginalis TaxID=1630135 RepID=UPI001EF41799|nr:choice-of-anchor M domain-containing protein [Dermabacter vaginalis]MCG7444137.1 choice-of-anchor M domain-containing protein [Dermabacter vaginalis]
MRILRSTCVTLAAFTLALAPAFAGPDGDRTVQTNAHIDAPKVFWDEGAQTFQINSQSNGKTLPLDKTTNWVGRGYQDDGTQSYVFDVTKDPRLSFLGKEGDHLYMAPHSPGPGNTPIWSGFGADTAVPIENFQDENFAIELTGFNGPGEMHMFNYSSYGDLPVTRLFSSHDQNSRAVWLDPGTHTHNFTTFTKPGRYELTYEASARKSDGTFTSSKPTTLVWRVGGTNPADEKLGDVKTAYDKAAGVTGESAPTFTIAPHTGKKKDGDENLADLTFDAGNAEAEGTVVFFIDGYHLAEIPVKGGKATWSEMIGSTDSTFQAVFVPTKGASRWVSAPLTSTTGKAATSTTESGEFPKEASENQATGFPNGEVKPTSRDVSVSAKVEENDNLMKADTKPADDSLVYHVTGGFYEKGSDFPTCEVDAVSGPGRRSFDVSREYCKGDQYDLRLALEPLPRAAIGNTEVADFGPVSAKGKEISTQFSEHGATGTPDTPEGGQPSDPGAGDEGADGSLLNTPVTINNGHVDLRVMDVDGNFSVALGDDSRQHAKKSVTRTIDSVTLEVTKLAKAKRGGNILADKSYDVLGPKGSELYILPQAQQQGRVWPGFSSEELDRDKYPNGATMTLTPVSAPEGGKWFAYTENLGTIQKMYATSEKASDIPLPPGTHMHTAWAFTKPGTYTIDVTAHAKQASNGERSAESGEATAKTQRLTFVVGEQPGGDQGDAEGQVPSSENPAQPANPAGDAGDTDGTGAEGGSAGAGASDAGGSAPAASDAGASDAGGEGGVLSDLPRTGASVGLTVAVASALAAGGAALTRRRKNS